MSDAVSALVALARLLTPQERAALIEQIARLDEPEREAVGVAEQPAGNLVDPGVAAKRFNRSKDTIRLWLRDSQEAGRPIGRKIGGRWMIDLDRAETFARSL